MQRLRITSIAVLVLTSVLSPAAFGQHCGKERWSVKTGTDSGAAQVGLANPQSAAISDLISISPPSPLPTDTRFAPTENTVFVLNAVLTDYKLESDSDYHLVLMDDQGNTMIAEIPSPSCVDPSSPFAAQVTSARGEFDAQLQATSSFQTANVPVQVTGVGFFDFFHNQNGVAPNVIELHPVLDIQFNPAAPAGDFALTASTPAMHLHANSTASTVIAASPLHGGSLPNPQFSVSGVPPGVTSHITPEADGKARVVLTASASVPTGTYPITLTGAVKGRLRSQTVRLHLSGAHERREEPRWEYQKIEASTEQDVVAQADRLGGQGWEMVSVVKVSGPAAWRAFFRRVSRE